MLLLHKQACAPRLRLKLPGRDVAWSQDGLTRMGEKQMSHDEGFTGGTAFMMFVLGAASECAATFWNGPDGASPRCVGGDVRVNCR